MTFSPRTKTFVTAAAFAIMASSLVPATAGQFRADTQRAGADSFAAMPASGGGSSAQDPEHCNNVSSCNTMIAYCAATGGDFEVRGSGPEGRPSNGTCSW
jgi:hypothetical protein